MTSEAHVELAGLEQRFGATVALDGFSLSLGRGELVTLLGPSGCGKTTALRIVAGFQRPTAGRVVVDGRDVTGVRPSRRDMGMVFQAYSLFPHLTAAENVAFGLRVRHSARQARRERARELLELVGLGEAAGRYPHQLSGGMQQRVALARALATEPRVLLLDEPLSALDAIVRVQLREEIRRLQSRLGITTLYVTHDQEEALSTSDRVAVMARGRIEQVGAPAEIYREPATHFVAEFIGTMNRIPVTVAGPAAAHAAGGRVAVAGLAGRPEGSQAMLLVRPESVRLTHADEDTGDGHGIPATVASHHFLGPITRVRVEAPAGQELRIDVPTGSAGWLAPGTPVVARFAPEDARVLDHPDDPVLPAPPPGGAVH